jgi:hypothetical protein
MKRIALIPVFFILFFFVSCSDARFEVDTSAVDYAPNFQRLDRAIFDSGTQLSPDEVNQLVADYGDFFDLYVTEIMQMPPPDNPMLPQFLVRFTDDPTWIGLQQSVEQTYPDLSPVEVPLVDALKSYSVHFNEPNLPKLVAYNSGFNVGIYPSDEWLGVGLEWYLSPENKVVKQLPPDLFPQYKRDKMLPEYLAINAFKGFLFFKHQDAAAGDDLLASLVFRGKMLFIAQALMEVDEATLLNYKPTELEWARESEYAIWSHIVENDLVFTKDPKQIAKMINDGPFTPGMPPESPGGVGNWVGLQMVEAYMNENKSITLAELVKVNERQILEKYKPGR